MEQTAPETPRPPWRPPAHWGKWAARGAFESLLIIFSVVLALTVTNWTEQQRTRRQVDQARGYLLEELTANRAALASPAIVGHHLRLQRIFVDTHTGGSRPAEARAAFEALFDTGLHVASFRDAVWHSVESGPLLGELPLTEAFLLSDVYQEQDRLTRMNERFVGSIAPMLTELEDGGDPRAAVTAVVLHMGDVTASEHQLIHSYDKAIAQLQG